MAPAGGSRADHSMTCEIPNSLRTSKTTKSISNTARADCHSNFSPTSVSHRWYISCREGEGEPVGKERKLVMIDEGVHAFLRDIDIAPLPAGTARHTWRRSRRRGKRWIRRADSWAFGCVL